MKSTNALLVSSAVVLAGCGGGGGGGNAGGGGGSSAIVALAQDKWGAAIASNISLSRGPCLGEIKPGWYLDIVHKPRQPVDNDPRNQCAAVRTGKAKHFVELTPNGDFVRKR
jgi:hypothetical protein